MLLNHRDSSLCRPSLYSLPCYSLMPTSFPNAERSFQNRLQMTFNYPILKESINNNLSLQPSILYLKEETLIGLGRNSFIRVCVESGEQTKPEMKVSLQTPKINRIGFIFGNRNGFYTVNQFKIGDIRLQIRNKLLIKQQAKNSLAITYKDYFVMKLKMDRDQSGYSFCTGQKFTNLSGIRMKLKLDKNLNYRLSLSRSVENMEFRDNKHEFCSFKINDPDLCVGGDMHAYNFRHQVGICNSIFIEQDSFPGPDLAPSFSAGPNWLHLRAGFKQKVNITPSFGYSWGLQVSSVRDQMLPFIGIFYKNIQVDFPLPELYPQSDWIQTLGFATGFALSNLLVGKLVSFAYKVKLNIAHLKESRLLYSKNQVSKKKIDLILKDNHHIVNRQRLELRVFAASDSTTQMLFKDDIWDTDFSNQKYNQMNPFTEITETFFFYNYVLGYLPAQKQGLIGYLEPVRDLGEEIKIIIIRKEENQIKKTISSGRVRLQL